MKRHTLLILTVLLIVAPTLSSQWKQVTNGVPNAHYLDVFFLPSNPNFGWICGFGGRVLRTTDGGDSWVESRLAGIDMLESVSFVSTRVGYTSGPGGPNSAGVVFRTDDGGASWRDVTPSASIIGEQRVDIWGCYFLNENLGWATGGGCGNGVDNGPGRMYFFKTTNGGNSWLVAGGLSNDIKLSDPLVFPSGIGYASGAGVIFLTTDFGNSWALAFNTGARFWQEEITFLGGSFLVPTAGTDCNGTSGNAGSLRFSENNGASFNNFQTGQPMFGTFLLSREKGWGCGGQGSMYYTSNAGTSWTKYGCGLENADLDDCWFIDDTTGWVVGQGVFKMDLSKPPPLEITTVPSLPTNLCWSDSLALTATEGFTSYQWSNGARTRSITVRKSGDYRVTGHHKPTCTNASDTVNGVFFYPKPDPKITLSGAPDFCDGDSVSISGDARFTSFSWKRNGVDFSAGKTFVSKESGRYTFIISDSVGCLDSVEVEVRNRPNPVPHILALGDTDLCPNEFLELTSDSAQTRYNWSTGDSAKSIFIRESGTYFLNTVNQWGCIGKPDTLTVRIRHVNDALELLGFSSPAELHFDSTRLGLSHCRDVRIRNRDSLPYTLNGSSLRYNTHFSAPPKQFPLTIPAEGEATISICFAPLSVPFLDQLLLDTLLLRDYCNPLTLPMDGKAKPIVLTGGAGCEINIVGEIGTLGSGGFVARSLVPNPAHATVTIRTEGDHVESIQLISALGEVRSVLSNISREQDSSTTVVDVSDVASGLYVLVLRSATGFQRVSLAVDR